MSRVLPPLRRVWPRPGEQEHSSRQHCRARIECMTLLVTGSAGHLGEALVRTLRGAGRAVRGMDLKPTPFTDHVGSITDRAFVAQCLKDVRGVIHTATLHKPHLVTHCAEEFLHTNVAGTLALLEEASAAGV